MADVKWTKEQQKVIDLRNRNILVSAAAGSGKTAVLVERIIKKITDREKPVDIDKILVVTFTKAAAAEMRERISKAIEKQREICPEDENLQRQSVLVHNAQITTIDSFCLFVVRNHFEDIGLDPNFRIADEGEIKLLEMDVLAEVFSRNYEKDENSSFLNLIDAYSDKRSDDTVREMVSKIYKTSSSDSWPRQWIIGLDRLYRVSSASELAESDFIRNIVAKLKRTIVEAKGILESGMELALEPGGPAPYAKTISEDLSLFEGIDEITDYDSLKEFFDGFAMKNLARCTGDVIEEKKTRVASMRNGVKDQFKELKEKYFSKSLDELVAQLNEIRPYVEELIRLSIEYFDAMDKAKREKRILDFADIEHLALKILVDEDTRECRQAAEEFRSQFEEIMIDEYQDSNQVQEDIMCAISRSHRGTNNMFMVGDVKQSIYRFRLARPELFMGKYESYTTEDSDNQRIDLYDNFRSRNEVVDFVNDIFFKIMAKDLGNVMYDQDAALHFHATFPDNNGYEPVLLLCDKSIEEGESKKLEALMIAHRIKEIVGNTMVTDKDTKKLRPARYSDIVILLRSISGWGDVFADTLKECGVDAYVESSTGYFSAYEVQVVLAMLKLLDNPYQDIPMAAVLKSPMVGLDDEELAEIAAQDSNLPFAHKAMNVLQNTDNPVLARFFTIYNEIRGTLSDTPVHNVIQSILEKTGFGYYAAAMPAGNRRSQNLNMLIEKAIAYEKTSYKGLYHFVRYIDQLQKYDIDFGEANVTGDDENLVRIMTIHKSKGLEFPIVFVAGMGKKFAEFEKRDKLVIHPDMGLGIDQMTLSPRTKSDCIVRTEILDQIMSDDKGEELRVLYVALTRAKEKLFLSGVVGDAQKLIESAVGNTIPEMPISYSQRIGAKSFIELIIPALISYPGKYNLQPITIEELAKPVAQELAQMDLNQQQLLEKVNTASDYSVSQISKYFNFEYSHSVDSDKKRKYSVSELKHKSMAENYDAIDEQAERPAFAREEREPYVPAFARADASGETVNKVNPGALRGTAVHRFMECLDFAGILDIDVKNGQAVKDFVKKQLEHQLKHDMITKEMFDMIIPAMMERFVKSDVAHRMAVADKAGLLYKEKPFVMKADEGFLIQGIIDVFWFEGDDIVLLDYKTDSVEKAKELELRYKTQLELYGKALSKIYSTSDKKVISKECLIYSFKLQEVINL